MSCPLLLCPLIRKAVCFLFILASALAGSGSNTILAGAPGPEVLVPNTRCWLQIAVPLPTDASDVRAGAASLVAGAPA